MPRRPRPGPLRKAEPYRVVLVTAGSLREARRLAQGMLRRRLAACVNILPSIESLYRWEGKLCSGREALLVIKTRASRLPPLYRFLSAEHSYQLPEFLALPVTHGGAAYLGWLRECLR